MLQKDDLRQSIIGSVILLYFLPLLLLCGYAVKWISLQISWGLLGIGLCTVVAGSITLILKIWQWESAFLEQVDVLAESKASFLKEKPRPPTSEDLEASLAPPSEFEPPVPPQHHFEQLQRELQERNIQYQELLEQIRKKAQEAQELYNEKEDLQNQLEQLRQELFIIQQTSREQLKQKEQQVFEASQTINDLRTSMEKKQQQVVKLESSVKDLTYEVKTLLQISDMEEAPSSPPVVPPVASIKTSLPPFDPSTKPAPYSLDRSSRPVYSLQQDASVQLKRCIDTAQKLTGANHLGLSSRFRDIPMNSYALEQRRLFDTLQSENANVVLVYSQKEDKLLFANNQTKALLGWSPEKFVQDFPTLVQTSFSDWKKALASLGGSQSETRTQLVLKSRAGTEQPFHCLLGTIPTGIFKNHIIIVLYPPS